MKIIPNQKIISEKIVHIILLLALLANSCKKESNHENQSGGNNNQQPTGSAALFVVEKHHTILIPSQPGYPDTIFVKHHTDTFPGLLPVNYDTFYVGIPGDTFVKIDSQNADSMYLFATGMDTSLNSRVIGASPYVLNSDTGNYFITIFVTE